MSSDLCLLLEIGPIPDYLNPVFTDLPDIFYQEYPDLSQTFIYPVYTDLPDPTHQYLVYPDLRCL